MRRWFQIGFGWDVDSAGCLITGMFVKKYIDFKKKCEMKKKIKRKQEECQKSKRKLANHLMEMKARQKCVLWSNSPSNSLQT